jgi:TonB family protein
MRPILSASLLLSPMLFAASAVASQPKTDAPAATQGVRVSTGITVPAILDSANIRIPANTLDRTLASEAKVVLALNVDEKGNAQNVRILQSANPDLDARVVAAVRQSHFRPAKLDHQAIPVDLNLIINVQR